MGADTWESYLVSEHELIERVMAVLETELERLKEGKHDRFRLPRALDFLLEFGTTLHNRKEEELLFPLMEQRGIPRQGPIGVMLMEHEAEVKLIGDMLTQLPLVADDASARSKLASTGLVYLGTRREHIWKENDILYPMGRSALTEEDGNTLLQGFDKIDRENYGEDAHIHYEKMVEELEQGEAQARRPINNLSPVQLDAIFEALPIEVTFVDANDQVAYFNRLDRTKIFTRTRSALGRKIEKCHPQHSVHVVQQIVEDFRAGVRDVAEFWIDFKGQKVHIRYFPVRGLDGEYLGVVEVTQNIGPIQALEGQKRLLD